MLTKGRRKVEAPESSNIRKPGEEIVVPGESWGPGGTPVVEGCNHCQAVVPKLSGSREESPQLLSFPPSDVLLVSSSC